MRTKAAERLWRQGARLRSHLAGFQGRRFTFEVLHADTLGPKQKRVGRSPKLLHHRTMRVRLSPPLLMVLWASIAASAGSCRSRGSAETDAAPSASLSLSLPPVSASVSAPPAPLVPLQLLRFTFSSRIRSKEPVDVLEAAEPGQRVWAHFTLRNRSGETRKINVTFAVNGEKRTTLPLKVEPSWSFRTWGYNTLRKADKEGEVSIEAIDDQGVVITTSKLPIKAKAITKKLAKDG